MLKHMEYDVNMIEISWMMIYQNQRPKCLITDIIQWHQLS